MRVDDNNMILLMLALKIWGPYLIPTGFFQ